MTETETGLEFDEIEFHENAAYFSEIDTAVVSDLHVGMERAAQKRGMSMPLGEDERLENRLRDVLYEFEPAVLVFNGDVHHSFGELGDAGDTIKRLGRITESEDAEPVFVKGNHDTMLDSIVETHDWYMSEGDGYNVLFIHGDEMPANLPDAELYVVGHDHPTVEIEMQKTDCFLYGSFDGSRVLMTPAFNPLCSGVVINRMYARDFMSPFVRGDFGEFRVAVENEDGEVLRFPPIDEFREML